MNAPSTKWSDWLALVDEEVVDPDLRIVDAHLHLWPSEGPKPAGVDDRLLPYGPDELSADVLDGHNIVRTVFVECGAAYRQSGPPHLAPVGETEFVAEAARTHPDTRIGAIVPTTDLRLAELDEVLDAHEEAGEGLFRGIRHSIARAADHEGVDASWGAPAGMSTDPAFRRGVARLGARGLLYESWQYHYQALEFRDLARAVPETTMVLEHLCTPIGVADWSDPHDPVFVEWKRGIEQIASCPNVVAKLGGTVLPQLGLGWERLERPRTSDEYLEGQRLYYEHMLESFGPERCMFESNFSVDQYAVNYRTLWNAYKKLTQDFSPSERAEMFERTATRVYQL